MKITKAYRISKKEKERAMARHAEAKDPTTIHDSNTAVNGWDELLGQLYKPKKVTQKQFNKAKASALRIMNLISNPGYKKEMIEKIQKLNLN